MRIEDVRLGTPGAAGHGLAVTLDRAPRRGDRLFEACAFARRSLRRSIRRRIELTVEVVRRTDRQPRRRRDAGEELAGGRGRELPSNRRGGGRRDRAGTDAIAKPFVREPPERVDCLAGLWPGRAHDQCVAQARS